MSGIRRFNERHIFTSHVRQGVLGSMRRGAVILTFQFCTVIRTSWFLVRLTYVYVIIIVSQMPCDLVCNVAFFVLYRFIVRM